jgi:hypothetical protein
MAESERTRADRTAVDLVVGFTMQTQSHPAVTRLTEDTRFDNLIPRTYVYKQKSVLYCVECDACRMCSDS